MTLNLNPQRPSPTTRPFTPTVTPALNRWRPGFDLWAGALTRPAPAMLLAWTLSAGALVACGGSGADTGLSGDETFQPPVTDAGIAYGRTYPGFEGVFGGRSDSGEGDVDGADGDGGAGGGGVGGDVGGDYTGDYGGDDDDDYSTGGWSGSTDTGNATSTEPPPDTDPGATDGDGDSDTTETTDGEETGEAAEVTDVTDATSATDTGNAAGTNGLELSCLEEPVTLFMSADDSNSQAAPTLVRSIVNSASGFGFLDAGSLSPLRPYEFLNYYTYPYPAPDKGLGLYAEAIQTSGGDYIMQVGVRSENRARSQMRPVNLTLVLDTSGSMAGEAIARVRESCNVIAESLRVGDVLSIVTWSTDSNVLLDSWRVLGPSDPVAVGACASLSTNGGTDLDSGLRRGYELAFRNMLPGAVNRVVLMSDGGANVGELDPATIAKNAGGADEEGVFLAGVGMGTGYNDELMDTVTDYGRGAALFIDSAAEARRAFGARFVETFDVAALNVRVSMTMPPGVKLKKFFGEQISTDPTAVRAQHLAPNDQMVFVQTISTCLDAAAFAEQSFEFQIEYTDPVTRQRSVNKHTVTVGSMLQRAGRPILKTHAAVPAIQALYRAISGSPSGPSCSDALATLDAEMFAGNLAVDPDLVDLRATLARACRERP
jgi:Ca-activated chloride channel homolog